MTNPNESSRILQRLRPDTRAVVAKRRARMLLHAEFRHCGINDGRVLNDH